MGLQRFLPPMFASAVALVSAMSLAIPAAANDRHELGNGSLEVELRPGVSTPGRAVLIKAEYEFDELADEHDSDAPSEDATEPDADDADTDVVEPDEPKISAASSPGGLGVHPADESEADESEADESEADEPEAEPEAEPDDDEPEADESRDTSRGHVAAVAFTVDFGASGGVETMTATSQHGDTARALANHVYDEQGEYTVTVVATPLDGSSAVAPTSVSVTVRVGAGSGRVGGSDRFDTANRLSREDFPDGSAGAVLLARSDAFADALSSSTLAVIADAPVLLTNSAEVPDAVLDEISRVLGDTGTVYVLGGEAAISADVVGALAGRGYQVVRISGIDRVDTAVAMVRFLLDAGVEVDEVVLASAGNFPDALAGAAYSAWERAPILLTATDLLDPRVAEVLAALPAGAEVRVPGGINAVSDAVIAEVTALGLDVERYAGDDRFATAAAIADGLFPEATTVIVATGATFPDALAGAVHAGRRGAPVLLVGDTLPEGVRAYLAQGAGRIRAVSVVGGENAVPAAVMAEIEALLGLTANAG